MTHEKKMLIEMVDGGLVNYTDDCYSYSGCPTCDYGSEYINEINIVLTQYRINVELNKMYDYALSQGQMIKLFLSQYNTIQTMTEKEFVDWFKERLVDVTRDVISKEPDVDIIRRFDVTKI